MLHKNEVREQLRSINADFKFWGRAELAELPHVLFDNERIQHVINGRYTGGFALLCATDRRVLLIDKKPLYLTLEDIRYDMISDVMFNHRLLNASILLGTVHKAIRFIGYNHQKMRNMTTYVQQKVMELRTQQTVMQQPVQSIPQGDSSVVNQHQPIQTLLTFPQTAPPNPYRMPVVIKRRVSRFY